MEDFNNRYAELSTEIATRIEAIKFREIVPVAELARLWTANSDARNYVVVGDPAAKLAVAAGTAAAATRPELESIALSNAPAAASATTAAGTPPVEAAQAAAQALTTVRAAAAQDGQAVENDPRRQALRVALVHLEQAVELLKRALDAS